MTLTTFSADLKPNSIVVKYGRDELEISFHRTIRIADNDDSSELPPSLGKFSLYKVSDYVNTIPTEMGLKSGVFFPMYQAMWINFKGKGKFAVKVFSGGINVITGEPQIQDTESLDRQLKRLQNGETVQDYLVVPRQPWLDGFAVEPGKVRQFVAMPIGQKKSVEYQKTGREAIAGLQFEITPSKQSYQTKISDGPINIIIKTLTGKKIQLTVLQTDSIETTKCRVQDKEGIPPDQQRFIFDGKVLGDTQTLLQYSIEDLGDVIHMVLRLRGGGYGPPPPPTKAEMVLAAGGMIKQSIMEDIRPPRLWEDSQPIQFNVQILNSQSFGEITSREPPNTPISAATYAELGLPFFKMYEEPSNIVGVFDKVKSLARLENADGEGTEEQSFKYPLIYIDNKSSKRFRPVSELEAELKGMQIKE